MTSTLNGTQAGQVSVMVGPYELMPSLRLMDDQKGLWCGLPNKSRACVPHSRAGDARQSCACHSQSRSAEWRRNRPTGGVPKEASAPLTTRREARMAANQCAAHARRMPLPLPRAAPGALL